MPALTKLTQRISQVQSLLCVGLDSDITQLPPQFQHHATPQFAFNQWIIDQTHPYVAAYKPNLAFYEARGAQGWHELDLTMAYLRDHHPTIFTIADAKRADIDSTNQGYITAIFDQLGFDAITLHPYLGQTALAPFLERTDKVSIILCKTSNAGSDEIQDLPVGPQNQPLWSVIATKVSQEWNRHHNCMLVVGATYPKEMKQVREIVGDMPILVPGIGAQGGDLPATLAAGLTQAGAGLLINSSRSIIFAPQPNQAAEQLFNEINSI